MIKLDRAQTPEPLSLAQNGEAWGRELCTQRKEWHATGCLGSRPDAITSRYRTEAIKTALESLAGKKCHYCEERAERYDIEHFRPQSLYPLLAYRWHNLLLACQTCNQNHKGDRFPLAPDGRQATEDTQEPATRDGSDEAQLIHPCVEDPVEHVTFREGRILGITPKGETTIHVCQLNREFLTESRREYRVAIRLIIFAYHRAQHKQDGAQITKLGQSLQELSRDQARFAGMVRAELALSGYDWHQL